MSTTTKTRQYVILIIFGLLLGSIPSFLIYKILNKSVSGSEFESIDDLRKQMVEKDSRDTKDPNSVSLRTLIEPDPSDEIIYKLKSNLNLKFQGVPVTTNSHGMRNPEITLVKPNNTFRIALLGDSFTFGWGVEEEKIFARIFENELNAKNTTPLTYQVLNFGIPGYSTFQETARYIRDLHSFKPDAVIIYFVENDFGLPFFIGSSANPLQDVSKFVKKAWSKEDPEALKKQQFLDSVLDPNKAIKKLLDFTEQNPIDNKTTKVHLVVNPGGKDIEKVVSKLWIRKKDPRLNVIRIDDDLKHEIETLNIEKSLLQLPNDPHPSAIKHEMIGRAMAKEFLSSQQKN